MITTNIFTFFNQLRVVAATNWLLSGVIAFDWKTQVTWWDATCLQTITDELSQIGTAKTPAVKFINADSSSLYFVLWLYYYIRQRCWVLVILQLNVQHQFLMYFLKYLDEYSFTYRTYTVHKCWLCPHHLCLYHSQVCSILLWACLATM